jgi:mono/diheme cytochrome c family protein
MHSRTPLLWALVAVCAGSLTLAAQSSSRRRAEAAKMTNPVPVSDESIDLGRRVYWSECVACHGELADGDSKMSYSLDPVPPSLVDAETKYGNTDGEMFVVIRDGVKDTSMKPYAGLLTEPQMWSVINFLHSLASQTPQH